MKKFTLSLILSTFALLVAHATIYTSTNNGDWTNPNNWSPIGIPNITNWPGDEVIIAHDITLSQDLIFSHLSKLTIQSGASLVSTEDITLYGTNTSSFTIESGGLVLCKDLLQQSPVLLITINGALTCTNKMTISGGTPTNFDGATITAKDCYINQNATIQSNNSTFTITNDLYVTGIAILNFNDSDFIIGNKFDIVGGAKSYFTDGSMQINKLGATGAGEINLMGTDLTVDDKAILTGGGKLNVDGDAVVDINELLIKGGASINGENDGGILSFGSIDIIEGGAINCVSGNCNFGPGSTPPSPLDLETGVQVLPVELLFFNAINQKNTVTLTWATLSEKNNAFFEIEKSYDAKNWSTPEVIEGAITSSQRLDYSYEEIINTDSPHIYYRLKQVDLDGAFSYSKVEVITNQASNKNTSIYPNPTSGYFKIDSGLNIQSVSIFSAQGQLIQTIANDNDKTAEITLPRDLAKGNYILQILSKNSVETHQLIVQ